MKWYRDTSLRPYLSAIDENDKFEFENDILKKVIKAYLEQNEEIIFKFPSFFFIARK